MDKLRLYLKKKISNAFTIFLLSFLFLSLIFNSINASNVRSGTLTSYFSTGHSLGFQNGDSYVLLAVTNGNLNSSNSQCRLYASGGYYYFTANETVTIQITYTVTTVKLAGDNNNEIRAVNNESSYSISQNDNIQIMWDITLEPFLPVMFIFGMVGLISMFGGSLLGISLIKRGEYKDGIKLCAIWVALGIALTVAWLWS